MRAIVAGALVVALCGMSALPVVAEEAAVAEKVGPSYTLTMEGMT